MKRVSWMIPAALLAAAVAVMPVQAREEKIESGIYAEEMDLSGMTKSQARQEIEDYVAGFGGAQITLRVDDTGTIETTAAELGLKWGNADILEEAVNFGRDGDILSCYKELKDLEYKNKVYRVRFDFDKASIRSVIEENAGQFNQEAVNATLQKTEEGFAVTEGQTGRVIDTDASVDTVYAYLTGDWSGTACAIDLTVKVDEPQGTAEDLAKVRDVLGTFTTSFSTSGGARSANVANGCRLLNGITMYPGDEISALDSITPFTEENGYYMAASYLNGQVVDSLGGGICQVSTTLYNAVLLAELEVTERYNHSMIVTYVDPSADAAIAESSGKDFKFKNNLDYPIYIDGYTTPEKEITFTIYGVETRDSSREVIYESEVLERIEPDAEIIYVDESMPVGYCSVQSAHIGYKARLWKIVKENGEEISREQVNSSSYMKAPRSATVGVATEDPNAYNAIMAAVATNSVDQVKAVAGSYRAAAEAAAAAQAAAQAAQNPQPEAPPPAE
ncbi:MAG: VanW family protein [Bacteroidales bacterium]|nr:VanW family protein [Bacteroidales bacterium]MCM1422503.1 VanW family protein [bacterium]